MPSPTKHREKGYWCFWGEDIVVFEMQMKTLSPFEGMKWLKTLSSSKCRWGHCRLWRHAMTEDTFFFEMLIRVIVAFWRHAMTEDIFVFEMCEDIVAFEGMKWLKTFLSLKCVRTLSPLKACNDWRHFFLWNMCELPYRASPHAIGNFSLTAEMKLFRGLGWKTLTSSRKVQMTTLVTACYRTLESNG